MALLFLLAAILSGCTDKDFVLQKFDAFNEDRVEVCLNVLIPLADLPSTRAIADDSQIDNYTVWVFENDAFVEAVNKTNTYTDAQGVERDRIAYDGSNGGTMTIALDSTLTAVRLMMIANCSVTAPAAGMSWADAEASLRGQTFYYDGTDGTQNYMPMYGTSGSTPFAVKQGMNGTIQLKRCMAKVVMNLSETSNTFVLDSIFVYHANRNGTVAPVSGITEQPVENECIKGSVDASNNIGTVYIPELSGITSSHYKTSVILKGRCGADVIKYYRLEFIKRDVNGSVSYSPIDTIKRNYSYIFGVDYLLETSGYATLQEALDNPASNWKTQETNLMVIDDENILDITTDNYVYLGVTSGNIEAVVNADNTHYAANIHIVTNCPGGWEIKGLPSGVSADPSQFNPSTPSDITTVQSVWVYFPMSDSDPPGDYHSGQEVVIYIYCDNIRKDITITMP